MSTPNIAVYAGGPLGPADIAQNLAATQQAGWTTIILGLFHIGRPDIPGQSYGDIIFNDPPPVISGKYLADPSWPDNVARLKQDGSSVTKVYASVGGGRGVEDYQTIQKIYESAGDSFAGTPLEQNFGLLRETFPAIDGIDLDCEDNYDQPSFQAFCELLIGMDFHLTFCPYANTEFWTTALGALEKNNPGAVAWWNLQCYDGGLGNDPQKWAKAIAAAIPSFSTDGYIVPGDWTEDSPGEVETLMSSFAKEPSVGGGFIWNLDGILSGSSTMEDYVDAIRSGLQGE